MAMQVLRADICNASNLLTLGSSNRQLVMTHKVLSAFFDFSCLRLPI